MSLVLGAHTISNVPTGADDPDHSAVCLHACDKDPICCEFIKSHSHGPVHLHDDINGRLSRRTLIDLETSEKWANEELAKTMDDKSHGKHIGDLLLQRYIEALDRPGAFIDKGFCRDPSQPELFIMLQFTKL